MQTFFISLSEFYFVFNSCILDKIENVSMNQNGMIWMTRIEMTAIEKFVSVKTNQHLFTNRMAQNKNAKT